MNIQIVPHNGTKIASLFKVLVELIWCFELSTGSNLQNWRVGIEPDISSCKHHCSGGIDDDRARMLNPSLSSLILDVELLTVPREGQRSMNSHKQGVVQEVKRNQLVYDKARRYLCRVQGRIKRYDVFDRGDEGDQLVFQAADSVEKALR